MKSFRLFGVKFTKVKYIDSGHYIQQSELFPRSCKFFVPEKRIFFASKFEIFELIRAKYYSDNRQKLDFVITNDWSNSRSIKSSWNIFRRVKSGECKIFYNYEDLEKHLDKIALLR